MTNINTLIQQTKEEIESTRAILQTYLPSDLDIDEMHSSEILEFAMQEDERIRDSFLIQWKDYAFLRGGLIKLQTAKDIFLRMIDEVDFRIKEMQENYKDVNIPLHIQFLFEEWQELKQKLGETQ